MQHLLSGGVEAVVEGVCLDGRRDDAVVAGGPEGDAHVEHDVLVADRGQATKLNGIQTFFEIDGTSASTSRRQRNKNLVTCTP